ncbi:MAG: D-alanyl-D-alanine carboxypeptidase/D-alanyl-D-alanine-endopeptidase, partial [Myxococcales bacterium]|nr:D-alanyl-D-alanine carboxypeptidase/D-alanyl-D-alanine-endopeptidase [Myxococcales bacterium]
MRTLLLLLIGALAAPAAVAQGRAGTGPAPIADAVNALLADKALNGAKIAIYAARADGTGKPLYAYEADTRLHPASNTKVVTTAAALVSLGPTFAFRTDLFAEDMIEGKAKALYLQGRGDPRLYSEELWKLLDEARFEGLRAVEGDVVVDDSYFTERYEPPGYEEKPDDDASYRAPSGALSLDLNAAEITLLPGANVGDPPVVRLRRARDYFVIENGATTTRRGRERLALQAKRAADGRTRLIVSGRIAQNHPGITVRRRIDHPALYAGYAAKQLLQEMGIQVKGKVRVGAVPGKGVRRLGLHYSQPVSRQILDVNKWSINMMAEALVRAMGRVRGTGGDWAGGVPVVTKFLNEDVGIKGFTYTNGSGLFGATAFSPRELVKVLQHMHGRTPALPEFAASLALGGRDGTLRRRFRGSDLGRVRAKTGTL